MSAQPSSYEAMLARCTHYQGAVDLLRRHRPYLEAVPSMRRPQDSLVSLPHPNVQVQEASLIGKADTPVVAGTVVTLPCDLVLLMCDPEWQVKTGLEILVFIHRPREEFSELLLRWRRTERLLVQGCHWILPPQLEHLLSDGAEVHRPLFVVFPETPPHIRQGLVGAALPVVVYPEATAPADPPEDSALGDLDQLPELEGIDPGQLQGDGE